MINLIEVFTKEILEDKYLIIMPISRLIISHQFSIGCFKFYPAGEVNLAPLRIIPNQFCQAQNVREAASSITGFCDEILKENTVVVFAINMDWNDFLSYKHEDDIRLISNLSQQAEEAMDLIRFYFCRMDLPDTLPGPVGIWGNFEGFSGALINNPFGNESYLIAGSVISHMIVKGLGLELDKNQIALIQNERPIGSGEVGSIVRTALSLFSGVLESNNPTTKFIRSMNLFEYLAYPSDYKPFKDVKKQIMCHIAKTKHEYEHLSNRFFELIGQKDKKGKISGFRTKIIHLGYKLEEIVNTEEEINKLFRELHGYLGKVIDDMISYSNGNWDSFMQFRDSLKKSIGINN